MNWQDAIRKSPYYRAIRKTRDGRICIRFTSGEGEIQLHNKRGFRIAKIEEISGYDDWKPEEI